MQILENKNILLTGLLSRHSIAYGIAKACHSFGANLAFTYQNERFEKRIRNFAEQFGSSLVFPCDVSSDEQIISLFEQLGQEWSHLDGLVHSIAYAPRDSIGGGFVETCTREAYLSSHDISAYSLIALAREARNLLKKSDAAALVARTYLGSVRAIPHYNTMGLAKASLESAIRYIASDFGTRGIRINGISAGPIKTVAASGISDFSKMLTAHAEQAALGRNVTIEEVGNVTAFLLSSLASGISGEIIYVDAGMHNTAMGNYHKSSIR